MLAPITLSFLGVVSGQAFLRSFNRELSPNLSERKIWSVYRWSLDPRQRREAALLLVAKSQNSPKRILRLLAGQGWGRDSLAAVALKVQGKTYERLGQKKLALGSWNLLVENFPNLPISADAYYSLGEKKKKYRDQLVRRFPSHPASLANAIESSSTPGLALSSALHLARWGARWPGAKTLFSTVCLNSTIKKNLKERQLLANGLAVLGDSTSAIECLGSHPIDPPLSLSIGRLLVTGNQLDQDKAKVMLLNLVESYPGLLESKQALKVLFQNNLISNDFAESLLKRLINSHENNSVDQFRDEKGFNDLDKVVKSWFHHSSAWEANWILVRSQLLKGEWDKARDLMAIFIEDELPDPIASRQLFWKGFVEYKLGNESESKKLWQHLVNNYPSNYYTWRASKRLAKYASLASKIHSVGSSIELTNWTPLVSRQKIVNLFWRIGLEEEAWETWRSLNITPPLDSGDLSEGVMEARLRISIGDEWMGLHNLDKINLLLVGGNCTLRKSIHISQYPLRFIPEIDLASNSTKISRELLLAIAKQESRFSVSVTSSAGAIGLMQLLPESANEVSDYFIDKESLKDPQINFLLGARYVAKLLNIWEDNYFLAIASYNAGLNAVAGWESPELLLDPELWIERIPYPETRFYTKKVLGNFWAYSNLKKEFCVN